MKNTTSEGGTAALGCPAAQSSTRWLLRALDRLKSGAQIFAATVHEIFDESAYGRYLDQKQIVSTRAAYAAFRRENEAAKARRPKCC